MAAILAATLVCVVLAAPARAAGHARSVQEIICIVFNQQCPQALRVAWCESRFDVWARNGQYFGIFQLGSRERAVYGQGYDAWSQARAAHRYFLAAGWRPWQCKPW